MQKPKLFTILKHRDTELPRGQIGRDILSGIIVAVIALPLSIALAIASGVTPEKGLVTAVIAGFLISALGGSRVQIGGPTGAFVIIVHGIIVHYGMNGLLLATMMAGVLMILFGLMELGTIIRYIPYPIITGFTSGIALVLFSTQVRDFLGLRLDEVPSGFIEKWQAYFNAFDTTHWATLGIGLLSLILLVAWPRVNRTLPGSLVALIAATLAVLVFKLPVATIGSTFGEISNRISLIDFGSLDLSLAHIRELVAPAVSIALLASVESLLSAAVSDGMIGGKHRSNMELIAQGAANLASACFGGIPATGAIARTAANVKNGGRTPIAGMVHAVTLLLFLLFLMPLAKYIPLATLAAILMVVAYNMSEWRSFKALLRSTKSDAAILLVTFTLTVLIDLVFAIGIGLLVAMFFFIRRMSASTEFINMNAVRSAVAGEDEETAYSHEAALNQELKGPADSRIMVYNIDGPLFFGVANAFLDIMDELHSGCQVLVLNFQDVPNMDASAIHSLDRILQRCRERHITLLCAGIRPQPMKLIENTGLADRLGRERLFETPHDAIFAAGALLGAPRTKKGT